jgi:hypothetical protein
MPGPRWRTGHRFVAIPAAPEAERADATYVSGAREGPRRTVVRHADCRIAHQRRIPFGKSGHLLRFDPDEIDAWVASARVPAER